MAPDIALPLDQDARFWAYAADDGRTHAHAMPEAESFWDAAILFAEIWHPGLDAEGQVTVIVVEHATGAQQCYRVDVGAGEAAACD